MELGTAEQENFTFQQLRFCSVFQKKRSLSASDSYFCFGNTQSKQAKPRFDSLHFIEEKNEEQAN